MTQSDYRAHSGLSKARVSQLAAAGMPLTTCEAADDWRRRHTNPKRIPPLPAADQAPESPPATDPVALEGCRVAEAFQRLEKAERAAWALLTHSLKNQTPDAARLLGLHSQAVRHLTDHRQAVLDLAERERRLVSGDWVRRVMQEHDGAVAALIRAMPRQLAGRIAPHDPEHAEAELDRWVQEVALRTLHNTDPWR